MSLENLVIQTLGARPLGQTNDSGRQPTTRLDYTGTIRRPFEITKTKIIQSKNLIETYDFEKPIAVGMSSNSKKESEPREKTRSEEHRSRTIIRAINNLRRLTHLNFTENNKFLTLTFGNEKDFDFDINNLSECLICYQKLMRKLRAKYKNLKYITVPEFQKRGAVHYHILCNLPYLLENERMKLWAYGWSKLKAIKSTTHLALYLTKYLAKKFDDKRKLGHRLYYTSRGLKRPTVVYGWKAEEFSKQLLLRRADDLQYENKYETHQNGITTYRQYIGKK